MFSKKKRNDKDNLRACKKDLSLPQWVWLRCEDGILRRFNIIAAIESRGAEVVLHAHMYRDKKVKENDGIHS
jgi:hypothetical protein